MHGWHLQVYSKYFLKEGVVHAMEQLALTAPAPASETPPEAAEQPPAVAAPPLASTKKETRSSARLRVQHACFVMCYKYLRMR